MSDPRRLPVGAVTVRDDGKAWKKTAQGEDFEYIGDGRAGGEAGDIAGDLTPGAAWQALAKSLKLDGHLPHETVHPSHVQIDTEGDIDTKPVLQWTDHAGNTHSTYTKQFHWNKAHHHTAQSKAHSKRVEKAFNLCEMTLEGSAATDPTDALICAHLSTGHRVNDLLKLRGVHASVDGGVDVRPPRPQPIAKSENGWKAGTTVVIHGVPVTIEYEPGDLRHDKVLPYYYGHIPRTRGLDQEELDVFVYPGGTGSTVVVVNQADDNGGADEQKVMLLFPSVLEAVRAYQAMYPLGKYSGHYAMGREDFAEWVKTDGSGEVSYAFAKSHTAAMAKVPHPHRVTMVMPHAHGHVYPTHVAHQHVADYVMQHSDPAGPLFPTDHEKVSKRLGELGIGDVSESDVRHMATRRTAADLLSKMGDVDLGAEGGMEQFNANLRTASDEIAARLGHPPSPEDMSFVHPHVAMAYAEQCNGAALWPKIFQKSKTCASPQLPDASSIEATTSKILQPTPTPDLPPPASGLELKTPTQSPRLSLSIQNRPWHQVADQVEEVLGVAYYDSRLPPLYGKTAPRYDEKPQDDDDFVEGTVFQLEHAGNRQWYVLERITGANTFLAVTWWDRPRPGRTEPAPTPVLFELVDGVPTPRIDINKSVTAADHQQLKTLIDGLKPKKNWKVGRAMMRISALAKKARKGDADAAAALRNVIDLINNSPDHGFDVPVSKSFLGSIGQEIDADVEAFFHRSGDITLHISKSESGPGPEGVPTGTVREHADGSKWEKRDDGWHEVGGDHQDKPEKEAGTPGRPSGGKGDGGGGDKPQQRGSAIYNQSVAALGRLKAMYEATSDPDEKKVLAQQIAVVRNRIAAVERTMDAGQIQPENRTKEREVSMSEVYASAFPDLARSASKFAREDDFYIHVGTAGTVGQRAELKALIAQHGQRAHSIVKGWLK